MRSVQLQAALTAFLAQAAASLHADVLAGQEVPFELESRGAGVRAGRGAARGRSGASLYCYTPLSDVFLAERFAGLRALDAYPAAVAQLARCETLERYLLARGVEAPSAAERDADAALLALLQDVFAEQTDFDPSWLAQHPERVERALERLEGAALTGAGEVTLVATLHGLAISSPQIVLARALSLAQPQALHGVPTQALRAGRGDCAHLLVVHTASQPGSGAEGVAEGVEVVRELLRALRLFGDGRIALGARAWARVGDGRWSTLALGAGGHPHGMLLVTPEQEDELRAFCALISRRTPVDTPIAWALRRFELGCDRGDEFEGLSDHLLALRALLSTSPDGCATPQGLLDGLLAARLAALCATPARRSELSERTLAAVALERECVAGTAVRSAAGLALARELSDHLRALLRDVLCAHLGTDLAALADEILLAAAEQDGSAEAARSPDATRALQPTRRVGASAGEAVGSSSGPGGAWVSSDQLELSEQQLADQGDGAEILRVAV